METAIDVATGSLERLPWQDLKKTPPGRFAALCFVVTLLATGPKMVENRCG
jgi:hypothetical protein